MSGITQPKQPTLTTTLTSIVVLSAVYVGLLFMPQAIAIISGYLAGVYYCRIPGARALTGVWFYLWIPSVIAITTLVSGVTLQRTGLVTRRRTALWRAGVVKGAMLLCVIAIAALALHISGRESPAYGTVIIAYLVATGAVSLMSSGYAYGARRGQLWIWSAILWVESIAFGLVIYVGLVFAIACAK